MILGYNKNLCYSSAVIQSKIYGYNAMFTGSIWTGPATVYSTLATRSLSNTYTNVFTHTNVFTVRFARWPS